MAIRESVKSFVGSLGRVLAFLVLVVCVVSLVFGWKLDEKQVIGLIAVLALAYLI